MRRRVLCERGRFKCLMSLGTNIPVAMSDRRRKNDNDIMNIQDSKNGSTTFCVCNNYTEVVLRIIPVIADKSMSVYVIQFNVVYNRY